MNRRELKRLDARIRVIRKAAQDLKERHGGIPAVERNASGILASLKMLEINVGDLAALLTPTGEALSRSGGGGGQAPML